MKNRWETLEEFPDYAISDEGEVVNIKTNISRRMSINQGGILKITLYKNRKELYTRSVAVLVAETFVNGRTEFFDTPIHLDGDRQNCRADNLMWRPRWFAVQYHRQFESPEFHASDVHIVEINSGREYYSNKEACVDLGLYYNDVYRSYAHGRQIPLTREEFRLVEE